MGKVGSKGLLFRAYFAGEPSRFFGGGCGSGFSSVRGGSMSHSPGLRECAFLASGQVKWLLPAWGPHVSTVALDTRLNALHTRIQILFTLQSHCRGEAGETASGFV